jgi:flagellar hook-associated protein 3 FlgL
VTDTTTNTTYSSNQPYTAGSAIDIGGGESISISGTPSSGDQFNVTPATKSTTDVFQTLDNVISALQTPVGTSNAAAASLTNSLNAAMTQLNNSLVNVTTVQASVGGREQELQALQTSTTANQVQTTSNLQDLTGTNMVQTISQYEQVQNALSASQKSFVQIQQLSLFQYINT